MPTVLILLILGLLVVLVVGLQVYKKIEQARIEKLRRIAQLTHAYRLTQRYLSSIPGQYLSVQVRIFLIQRAVSFLEKLRKEEPRNSLYRSKLALNEEQLKDLQDKPKPLAGKIPENATVAAEASNLLTECSRFIQIQSKQEVQGTFDPESLTKQLQWNAVACMTDFHQEQAKNMAANGAHRKAIYHLNNVIARLAAFGGLEAAQLQMAECHAMLTQQQELAAAKEEAENSSNTKLDHELGNMLEEESKEIRKSPFD